MKKVSEFYQNHKNIIVNCIFPVILLLYPLMKVNQGVDVSDSTYSLGNYLFFPELKGTWMISTYLSNVLGFLLMKLPFGRMLMGMNFYTALFVSVLVLLVYYMLRKWMPDWIVFIGEFIAVGFLWIPTGILYNYLTYFLFTVAALLLYKGLTEEKNIYLFWAGVTLGCNVFVRVPNLAEMALILMVWYAVFSGNRGNGRKGKLFFKLTGICIGGYLTGLAVPVFMILLQYGLKEFTAMFAGLTALQGSDESYSILSMIGMTVLAYLSSGKWLVVLLVGLALGICMFAVLKDLYTLLKKILYVAGLLLILRFYWGRGMFSFRYYEDYTSMYEWGMLGLFLSWFACGYLIFGKGVSESERLLGVMSGLILLITPLGSNNYTYQNLNNLFLVAPVSCYAFAKLYRRRNREAFTGAGFVWKTAVAGIFLMILIQTVGFHSRFVFRDGMDGSRRDARMSENNVVAGMYTTEENAESLGGLITFVDSLPGMDREERRGRAIYLGDCPGLTYILQTPSALSMSWPDLDSEPFEKVKNDLEELDTLPFVIVKEKELVSETEIKKQELMHQFMDMNNYQQLYQNEAYKVYAVKEAQND